MVSEPFQFGMEYPGGIEVSNRVESVYFFDFDEYKICYVYGCIILLVSFHWIYFSLFYAWLKKKQNNSSTKITLGHKLKTTDPGNYYAWCRAVATHYCQ